MYMAKGSGKDGYQLYDPEVHDDMVVRSALHTDLAAWQSAPFPSTPRFAPAAGVELVGVEAVRQSR